MMSQIYQDEELLKRHKKGRQGKESEQKKPQSKPTRHRPKDSSKKNFNQKNDVNNTTSFSHYRPSIGDQIRIASGYKQAVVKVTNYGKGTKKILGHLRYISRHSKWELEDQNGTKLIEDAEFKDLLDTWEALYFDGRKNARDTVHITFSAPEGSDRNGVLLATRQLLKNEFYGKHDYVFVPHNDTPYPHVHAVIVMQSHEGKKLDPRKQYLAKLRKDFAALCRTQGIKIDASRRFERGLSGKSTPSAMVHMVKKRGQSPEADKWLVSRTIKQLNQETNLSIPVQQKMQIRNQTIRYQFVETAKKLLSELPKIEPKQRKAQQQIAHLLDSYAQVMPVEKTRTQELTDYLAKQKGATRSLLAEEKALRYQQYLAVSQGCRNQQGVFTIENTKISAPALVNEKKIKASRKSDLKKVNFEKAEELEND